MTAGGVGGRSRAHECGRKGEGGAGEARKWEHAMGKLVIGAGAARLFGVGGVGVLHIGVVGGAIIVRVAEFEGVVHALGIGAGSAHSLEDIMLMFGCGVGSAHWLIPASA